MGRELGVGVAAEKCQRDDTEASYQIAIRCPAGRTILVDTRGNTMISEIAAEVARREATHPHGMGMMLGGRPLSLAQTCSQAGISEGVCVTAYWRLHGGSTPQGDAERDAPTGDGNSRSSGSRGVAAAATEPNRGTQHARAGQEAPERGQRSAAGPPDEEPPTGVWRIRAPTGRHKAICPRCHQPLEKGEPRLSQQAVHGKCYHMACAPMPAERALQELPGWSSLDPARQRQAEASWAMAHTPLVPKRRRPNEDVEMNEGGPQLPIQEEDWLEQRPPEKATEPNPCEGIHDLTLRNMGFWRSIPWDAQRQQWDRLATIPREPHYPLMQLRGAVAGSAAAGPKNAPERIAAQKCFYMLDRLLLCKNSQARGGKRNQKGVSNARIIAQRIRMAWEGRWNELWQDSGKAQRSPGQAKARTPTEQMAADIKTIEEAFSQRDEKGAVRMLETRIAMAPEAKASRTLPRLFPRAGKALPVFDATTLNAATEQKDVETFRRHLANVVRNAPIRRGAGWGGSIAEFWNFAPDYAEWDSVATLLTQIALGRDVAEETMLAHFSGRVLAQDREEADKVRPLCLGNFFRRCINGAKARTFQMRVAEATKPLQHAAGGTRDAETMHKTALVNLDSRPLCGIHKFDVSNAHQE